MTACDRFRAFWLRRIAGEDRRRTAPRMRYNLARGNPLALRAFLVDMPKGAELHYHLGGGVYAETWIRDAVDDHLCVNLATSSLVKRAGSELRGGQRAGGNARIMISSFTTNWWTPSRCERSCRRRG